MKLLSVALLTMMLTGCIVINASNQGLNFTNLDSTPKETIRSVEIKGGGEFLIQKGDTHTFENTGTSEGWQYGYDGDRIVVGCDSACRKSGNSKATITLVELNTIALTGGGSVVVEGAFPAVTEFDVALTGGGDINALSVPADEVNVAIVGGGDISVFAQDELNVSIIGGGSITYDGNPEVNRSIIGGGSVDRIR